jgi:sugar phosphate isomerase/epimerase
MRYVYFTKLLQGLDMPALAAFCKAVGVDGADLAVRPGYPVHPGNAAKELPAAARLFRDEGVEIGLISAPTDLSDPAALAAGSLFEAAARAGVPAVKIGYFTYRSPFDEALAHARTMLSGFARLAERTGVRACYHTHSGPYLGNNAAALRLLLRDLDPHHVGAFVDTGHTAINGGPPAMELDTVRQWLSLLAIKDMAWEQRGKAWSYRVVPAGQGIVRWDDFGRAVRQVSFRGTVSLHGEYEAADMDQRKSLARAELLLLKKLLPA